MSAKKPSWSHIDARNFLANPQAELQLWLLWCEMQGWLRYPPGFFGAGRTVDEYRDLVGLRRDAPRLIERCIALGLVKRPGNYVPPVPHRFCEESEEGEHSWNTLGECNHCGRKATRAALRVNTKPVVEPLPVIEEEAAA